MRIVYTVGGAVLLAACGPSGAVDEPSVSTVASAIEGGYVDDADIGVVRLARPVAGGYDGCTSTFIAPNVLVTASHCVADHSPACENGKGFVFEPPASPDTMSIRTSTSVASPPLLYVIKEVRTPVPSGTCSPDMALVILTTNLGNQLRIHSPRFDAAPRQSEVFSAVGYGKTCATCDLGVRRRRDGLTIQCVGVSECSEMGGGTYPINPNLHFAGGTGACSGDSGGPAFDEQARPLGVVTTSFVAGNDCVGPTTYVRLDALKDFIVDTVRDAAKLGGYDPPVWAGGTGNYDGGGSPEAGAGGGSGASGGDAGSRTVGSGGSSSVNPAGGATNARGAAGTAGDQRGVDGPATPSGRDAAAVSDDDSEASESDNTDSVNDDPASSSASCSLDRVPRRERGCAGWLLAIAALSRRRKRKGALVG